MKMAQKAKPLQSPKKARLKRKAPNSMNKASPSRAGLAFLCLIVVIISEAYLAQCNLLLTFNCLLLIC